MYMSNIVVSLQPKEEPSADDEAQHEQEMAAYRKAERAFLSQLGLLREEDDD